jgi:hypothetical protein
MSQSTITFLILAATIAVFVWDRLPVAVVALGVALSLWASACSSSSSRSAASATRR